MGRKIITAMGGNIRGRTVAVLGLAFKQDTDDMRDSPAIAVVQALNDAGAYIRAFDPAAMDQAKSMLPDITYVDDAYHAIDGADALVIATPWDAFRALDLKRIATLLTAPVVVDLRNIFNPAEVRSAGLTYTGIGR
jgi:UDPglucose 6-dehydrogenase